MPGEPKVSYLARSASGRPVFSFENETQVRDWIKKHPSHRVSFFKQTITEEAVSF